jgi:predicted transcriptional regulator
VFYRENDKYQETRCVYLPKRYAYVLLEARKWWDKRCSQSKIGKTQAFVRRGKVGPLNAEQLFFYVKHPVREVKGKAEFVEHVVGNADELWHKYGAETVFQSYNEYTEFVDGRKDVTLIRFKNLRELTQPVSAKAFLEITGGGSMLSRNGKYISKELAVMFV